MTQLHLQTVYTTLAVAGRSFCPESLHVFTGHYEVWPNRTWLRPLTGRLGNATLSSLRPFFVFHFLNALFLLLVL